MHSLEFDRIYANMGTVTRISYDNAFSNPKSEKMIRQMVKSAFEGKIVKIPGTSISMSALVNQERFRLRFNTDSMKIGNKKFPEEGSILMYIHGTIIGGDTRPMQMIQGLLHNYDSMFFVPKDIEKSSLPCADEPDKNAGGRRGRGKQIAGMYLQGGSRPGDSHYCGKKRNPFPFG